MKTQLDNLLETLETANVGYEVTKTEIIKKGPEESMINRVVEIECTYGEIHLYFDNDENLKSIEVI